MRAVFFAGSVKVQNVTAPRGHHLLESMSALLVSNGQIGNEFLSQKTDLALGYLKG
jgi:hypothetical protein